MRRPRTEVLLAVTVVVAVALVLVAGGGPSFAAQGPSATSSGRAHGAVGGAERCDRTPTELELRWPGMGEAAAAAAPLAGQPPPFTYLLHVPERLPPGDVPLLVAMHGLGGSSAQFAAQSRWSATAHAHGFIVAFPNGPRKWDFREGSTDIAFIRSVIADVRASRCIDDRRIWATGHSMGGFMAQRLACEAGDLVAAAASTAGGNVSMPVLGGACAAGTNSAPPGYEPVAVGLWHGTADQLINYENQGRLTQRLWAERYQCAATPEVLAVAYGTRDVHDRCSRPDVTALGPPLARRFAVEFRTYTEHRHGYPDGCGGLGETSREPCEADSARWPTAESHNAEILRFLDAHPRRSPAGAGA